MASSSEKRQAVSHDLAFEEIPGGDGVWYSLRGCPDQTSLSASSAVDHKAPNRSLTINVRRDEVTIYDGDSGSMGSKIIIPRGRGAKVFSLFAALRRWKEAVSEKRRSNDLHSITATMPEMDATVCMGMPNDQSPVELESFASASEMDLAHRWMINESCRLPARAYPAPPSYRSDLSPTTTEREAPFTFPIRPYVHEIDSPVCWELPGRDSDSLRPASTENERQHTVYGSQGQDSDMQMVTGAFSLLDDLNNIKSEMKILEDVECDTGQAIPSSLRSAPGSSELNPEHGHIVPEQIRDRDRPTDTSSQANLRDVDGKRTVSDKTESSRHKGTEAPGFQSIDESGRASSATLRCGRSTVELIKELPKPKTEGSNHVHDRPERDEHLASPEPNDPTNRPAIQKENPIETSLPLRAKRASCRANRIDLQPDDPLGGHSDREPSDESALTKKLRNLSIFSTKTIGAPSIHLEDADGLIEFDTGDVQLHGVKTSPTGQTGTRTSHQGTYVVHKRGKETASSRKRPSSDGRGGLGDDQDDDDDDDDDEDEEERAREPKRAKTSSRKASARRLACPYHQRDPQRYQAESCVGPGFVNLARLKSSHLERHHKRQYPCPRCWAEFETQEHLQNHVRADDRCPNREPLDPYRIGHKLWEQIKKRKTFSKERTQEQKWIKLFKMLFPNDESVPSPYYGHSAPGSTHQYNEFLHKEMPILIAQVLMERYSGLPSSELERTASDFANVYKLAQERAYEAFKSQLEFIPPRITRVSTSSSEESIAVSDGYDGEEDRQMSRNGALDHAHLLAPQPTYIARPDQNPCGQVLDTSLTYTPNSFLGQDLRTSRPSTPFARPRSRSTTGLTPLTIPQYVPPSSAPRAMHAIANSLDVGGIAANADIPVLELNDTNTSSSGNFSFIDLLQDREEPFSALFAGYPDWQSTETPFNVTPDSGLGLSATFESQSGMKMAGFSAEEDLDTMGGRLFPYP